MKLNHLHQMLPLHEDSSRLRALFEQYQDPLHNLMINIEDLIDQKWSLVRSRGYYEEGSKEYKRISEDLKRINARIDEMERQMRTLQKEVKDEAMLADQEDAVGGIDFNAGMVSLLEEGEGVSFKMENTGAVFNPEAIIGVTPVIINISPITNFMPLLGLLEIDEVKKVQI